jgi:hypothetical protein
LGKFHSYFNSLLIIKLHGFIQSEYQRGVSAWNFDIEDLKAQASLVILLHWFPFPI